MWVTRSMASLGCKFWRFAFLPPRRGRNRKAQAGGTPLAGSALGI